MTLPAEILIEYFDLLIERSAALRERLAARDAEGLRTLVHQIAGTGGAYGYADLTTRGRALEGSLVAGAIEQEAVASLAALCEEIAREDLSRLGTACLSDPDSIGRGRSDRSRSA